MTETPLVLFHRTTAEKARRILVEGFRDGRGTFMTDREFEGVWLSDRPIDAASMADALLRVTLSCPMHELEQFEWRDESGLMSYREWLIPASLVNQYGVVQLIDDSEPDDSPPTPCATDR